MMSAGVQDSAKEETLDNVEVVQVASDLLIVGGGAAGCFAAIRAKEANPSLKVTIIEKAHIERSGCLAAGVNAINAYLNPGETPETFLAYVKKDFSNLVREDLVYTIAERLNYAAKRLEEWGVPFLKDEHGHYVPRGKRSVRINGESIKPILAKAVRTAGVQVFNRLVATNFIVNQNRVRGVFAFSVRQPKFYVITANAVICATGGAAGLYRPNNPGSARHKLWYPPHNTGAGLAMGLRAGAEMTTLEMRFIALRIKDVLAPTGTLAQGVSAPQINARGQKYQYNYADATTPMRLWATLQENRAGRGPCYLDLTHLPDETNGKLQEAYLNMAPSMVLKWADEEITPNAKPVEICGSEPYIVGGHGLAGYWVDRGRRSTLPGLYAAGDVAGGAPKKYVTGSMVEGERAALTAIQDMPKWSDSPISEDLIQQEKARVYRPLKTGDGPTVDDIEERLQKLMDEYAGGISTDYQIDENRLLIAQQKLKELQLLVDQAQVMDWHELMGWHEVNDRILVARALVEHLLYRKETRWKCYQERVDYPKRDDHRWLRFVNSVYSLDMDAIYIRERPYVKMGDYICLYE